MSGTTTVNVTPAVLTSIVVTPTGSSIAKGTTVQLTATGNFSDGSTQDLTQSVSWTSSDTTLATVDPNGLVTGSGVGLPTITATQGVVSGATTVNVTAAVLTSIVVTPTTPSIAKGTTAQLTATGNFSDGSTQDLTQSVSWTSSDTTVATVDPNGLVTGTGVGLPTITATQGGVSGTTTVKVTPAVLTSIVVTPTGSSIANGTTVQLTATGVFSDGTTQDFTLSASWTSTPAGFVTVNPGGLVMGTAVGSATITATQGGVSGATTVNVTPAVLTSIVVTPTGSSIAKGTTAQLTATGVFSDGTTQDFTLSASWTSAPAGFATVNPGGLVTGTAVGSATITATQGAMSGATTVTVTPTVLTAITITPPIPSIAKGTSVQLTATGTFSDGTTQDLTGSASWTSAPMTGLATVDPTGLVTGTSVGSANITANQAGVSGATTVNVTPPALTSIVVTPAGSSIAKGTSVQLTATGVFSDGTTQDFTLSASWTSAPAGFATVQPGGLVTGTSVGSANITANQAGVSGATTVTVSPAVLTSIVVTPTAPSIAKGTSGQLAATGTLSDGTTQDLTHSVSWTSAPAGFATVDPNGLVTGTSVGSATVTATQAGVSGATTVNVTPAVLTSIVVTPTGPSIANGTAVQLTATGTLSDGTTQDLTHSASWTSAPAGFVTVAPSGLVTGTAVGSATITATQAGVSGATTVTVTGAILTSIVITPANPTLNVNGTVNLTATGVFSDGSTQNLKNTVSWTSSNVAIANVEPSGLVKARQVGTATITATFAGVSGATTVTVH